MRVIHKEIRIRSVPRRNLWLLAARRKSDCSQLTSAKAGG